MNPDLNIIDSFLEAFIRYIDSGFGLLSGDAPSAEHHIALAAELGLVPLLVLWQARIARRFGPLSASGRG